jgi:hypothetical protein
MASVEQFLVSGPPGLLGSLVPVFAADPDIELVSVSGPPAAPELIVGRMSAERADLLRRALGGHLLVEPDAVLTDPRPVPFPPLP